MKHQRIARPRRTFSLVELVRWYLDNAVVREGECLTFEGHIGNNGYAKITWNGKDRNLHRLVCEATHGAPTGSRSCPATHSCGNKRCINPEHLSWGTPRSNFLDTVRHGRAAKCRLTETQVRLARALFAKGYSASKLARAARVSSVNMLKCVKGLSYQWVTCTPRQSRRGDGGRLTCQA